MFSHPRPTRADSEDGFTLIELLVVIIIIGILAAIAIPVFLHQRQKGYDAAAKSDLHSLATSEETYYVDHGSYGNGSDLQRAGLGISTSKGNAVFVYSFSSNGYCLASTNASGTPSRLLAGSGVVYWFDNAAGGLQKDENSGCPAYAASGGSGWTGGNTVWANAWNGYSYGPSDTPTA